MGAGRRGAARDRPGLGALGRAEGQGPCRRPAEAAARVARVRVGSRRACRGRAAGARDRPGDGDPAPPGADVRARPARGLRHLRAPVLWRDLLDLPREEPDVALEVLGGEPPLAVLLVGWLLPDRRAGLARPLAARVDVVLDLDVDPDRLPPEAPRALVVAARIAHEDPALRADLHLGVVHVVALAGVTEHLLEAERAGEELQRGVAVLVEQVW